MDAETRQQAEAAMAAKPVRPPQENTSPPGEPETTSPKKEAPHIPVTEIKEDKDETQPLITEESQPSSAVPDTGQLKEKAKELTKGITKLPPEAKELKKIIVATMVSFHQRLARDPSAAHKTILDVEQTLNLVPRIVEFNKQAPLVLARIANLPDNDVQDELRKDLKKDLPFTIHPETFELEADRLKTAEEAVRDFEEPPTEASPPVREEAAPPTDPALQQANALTPEELKSLIVKTIKETAKPLHVRLTEVEQKSPRFGWSRRRIKAVATQTPTVQSVGLGTKFLSGLLVLSLVIAPVLTLGFFTNWTFRVNTSSTHHSINQSTPTEKDTVKPWVVEPIKLEN